MNYEPNTKYYFNNRTNSYQDTIPSDSGRSLGSSPNSAQTQMAGEVIGTAGNIGTEVVSAGLQYNANRQARDKAISLSNMQREDILNQRRTDNSLKQRLYEADVKNFELNKIQEQETLRHNTWLADFTKALENHTYQMDLLSKLKKDPNKSEQIKNIILGVFRGKQ